AYLDNSSIRINEDCEPIDDYWKSCSIYDRLADYAVDLLVAPCSSAASESLFSHASRLSSDLRNRVSASNLENQMLVNTNWHLLLANIDFLWYFLSTLEFFEKICER